MPLTIHDDRLTRRVGAAVLVAAALTVVFVVGVLDRMEEDGVILRIRFGEVVGLSGGSPVRLAGREIGEVRSVAMTPPPGAIATVRIDPDWAARVPINSEFFVDAKSPLAPRYVAIGPPPDAAPPGRALVDGDRVVGIDPPHLDRVLQRTWDNLTEVSVFIAAIRPAAKRIEDASARIATTVRGLEPRPGASARLDREVAVVIEQVEDVLAELRAGRLDPDGVRRLAARVEALVARVEATVADLRGQIVALRAALDRTADRFGPGVTARVERTLEAADTALASAQRLATEVRGVMTDATTGGGAVAAFAKDLELVD